MDTYKYRLGIEIIKEGNKFWNNNNIYYNTIFFQIVNGNEIKFPGTILVCSKYYIILYMDYKIFLFFFRLPDQDTKTNAYLCNYRDYGVGVGVTEL